MKHIWKAFQLLTPISYILTRKPINNAIDELPQDQIETTINKIFLTSQHSQFSNLKLFAFDAQVLGRQIATHLDITLGKHTSERFEDGQISLQILDSVRGQRVFLLKSFQDKDLNNGIIQLLLAVSAIKKAGASYITAIIPYFPYAKSQTAIQGKDFHTCFAADIVKMLQEMGCDQIITFNSQLSKPQGFTHNSKFTHLRTPQIVVPYFMHLNIHRPIIVGSHCNRPYLHNTHKLKQSFSLFNISCDLGYFTKSNYIGVDVKGRDVILYNNLLRTGNSLLVQSKELKRLGARKIYYFGFHCLASDALINQLIKQAPINELISTNSVFQARQNKRIKTISLAKLLAEIITVIYEQKSLAEYRAERQLLRFAYMQKIRNSNMNEERSESQEDHNFHFIIQ